MDVSAAVPLATVARGGSVRVILPTGKTLDVSVPAGIEEGKSIRLRGQGHSGHRGSPPGDVIVTIRYAPHPLFKVEGRDLRLDLPITLYEAILGARVRAPTLSGEVEVSIAAGTSGGRVLRLRGKGLPAAGEQAAGDLLATLRIVLPDEADGELNALMRKLGIENLMILARAWSERPREASRRGLLRSSAMTALQDRRPEQILVRPTSIPPRSDRRLGEPRALPRWARRETGPVSRRVSAPTCRRERRPQPAGEGAIRAPTRSTAAGVAGR